ncbi:MAG: V-type ATP synthase subunit I [Steroidobacteraceae bacterium]
MALRPAMAKWFELLIARDELTEALQRLADTGEVELQARSDTSAAVLLPALRASVDEYKRSARRYGEFWPRAAAVPPVRAREPEEISSAALQRLRSWSVAAEPLIGQLQKLAQERAQLELLERLLSQSAGDLPDLRLFADAGPLLASRAYVLPSAPRALGIPPSVLTQTIASPEASYLLAVGPAEQIAVLDDTLGASKARRFIVPAGLPADKQAARAAIRAKIEAIGGESEILAATLAELHRKHSLSSALGDLQCIEWLVENVPSLALTEHFAWITGWTSDSDGMRFRAALDQGHLHYLLRFPEAPRELIQPAVLRNPRWARPFELFTRLLGMPSANETDPSRVLAFVAPLMFGFMFADVGQGAVLVLAGAALRKRFPATELLVPGGIAAMIFGFLFGSVFADERLMPALWLRPLDRPLVMLEASLAGGACVILLGLVLDAVQFHWSGRATQWWATRAGFVLCYLGAICAPIDRRALWALPAGVAWVLIGSTLLEPSARFAHLGAAVGESLETLLQLAINTVSFVRIGAFALAHAGLGFAVAGLAASVGTATGQHTASWLMLAAGNALIIAIEGLVVGIQTTRLVLFEFFIRFLRGSGRAFRPLPLPVAATDLNPSSRTSA